MELLKKWLAEKGDAGVKFWYAFDPTTGKASITLFMTYISFWIAVGSLIALHFKESLLTATTMSFVFAGMFTVFYMIRKLNKASVNLKDKSINLENNEGDKSE